RNGRVSQPMKPEGSRMGLLIARTCKATAAPLPVEAVAAAKDRLEFGPEGSPGPRMDGAGRQQRQGCAGPLDAADQDAMGRLAVTWREREHRDGAEAGLEAVDKCRQPLGKVDEDDF